MDFLSKKRQYIFINNQFSLVRVHVAKISSIYNIWSEGKSKKYRDCIRIIEQALKNSNFSNLPPIIIVENNKIGPGAISSYNHDDDVIYFNSYFHTQERIDQIIAKRTFAATNLEEIIKHELAHKKHWDAVKRFYTAHKTRYNDIKEAKIEFDSKLESYISRQENAYLSLNVSIYADVSFKLAKKFDPINSVNEVIAEVIVKQNLNDPILIKLVESELNYGIH